MHDRLDAHLDAVLRASGSALKHYSTQKTLDAMRQALLIFSETEWHLGYNSGWNQSIESMEQVRAFLAPPVVPTTSSDVCYICAALARSKAPTP